MRAISSLRGAALAGVGRAGRELERRPGRRVVHYERVLGTSLELQVVTAEAEQARRAEAALLAEIDRLEAIYSRVDPGSELNRWQATLEEDVAVSPELGSLLRESLVWQVRTGGAFSPGADALSRLWSAGAATGVEPSVQQIAVVLDQLRSLLWSVSADGRVARRCSRLSLNLNAIAKGHIVDRACAAAKSIEGVAEVLVNIGGDLRHLGTRPVTVAVADPFSDADNAPPVARVRVIGQGVATSGRSRRGFPFDDRWFSHVIDPRTGYPAEEVVAASAIADDSTTADVLATAFSVLTPPESLDLAQSLPRVGCFLVTGQREVVSNAFWRHHSLRISEVKR